MNIKYFSYYQQETGKSFRTLENNIISFLVFVCLSLQFFENTNL